MIIGDPYKFSIFAKVINEWNLDETFCNGVMIFCIDGSFFPQEVVTASLRGEITYLRKKLENIVIDRRRFDMSKEDAFIDFYNLSYPEEYDVDNDYSFDISTISLNDSKCYVFAVSDGKRVRIMGAKLDYIIKESRHELRNIDVKETFITVDELKKIILQLDKVI